MDIVKHQFVQLVKNAVAFGALRDVKNCAIEAVSESSLSIMVKIKADAGENPGNWRYFSVKVTEHTEANCG